MILYRSGLPIAERDDGVAGCLNAHGDLKVCAQVDKLPEMDGYIFKLSAWIARQISSEEAVQKPETASEAPSLFLVSGFFQHTMDQLVSF